MPESIKDEGTSVVNFQYKTDDEGYIEEMTTIYPDDGKTIRYTFIYE